MSISIDCAESCLIDSEKRRRQLAAALGSQRSAATKLPTMANEHTPLITTVRVGAVRRRYRHNTCRRFCTIALASTLLFVIILFLLLTLFVPPIYPGPKGYDWLWNLPHGGHPNRTRLWEVLRDTPSADEARKWSQYYTAGPHLAGKNYSQVRFLHAEAGLDTAALTRPCIGCLDERALGRMGHPVVNRRV